MRRMSWQCPRPASTSAASAPPSSSSNALDPWVNAVGSSAMARYRRIASSTAWWVIATSSRTRTSSVAATSGFARSFPTMDPMA
jgi:hypothetical protein